MKLKILCFGFCLLLLSIIFSTSIFAASYPNGYVIENFQSKILVNQDTSLTIKETIEANFFIEKHGIIRFVPVIYTANGKTIKAGFKVISVTDENLKPLSYTTSRYNESFKMQIGDADKTLTGKQTYIITYNISKVLLRYKDHDEVYWNVTGHEWDTPILKASAFIDSPYASINKTDCFSPGCLIDNKNKQIKFSLNNQILPGEDFTIVAALDKNNQLKFPGPIAGFFIFLGDNWGFPVAILPLMILLIAWYKKGRDQKYIEGTIYYQPDNQKTKNVSLFERPHLPLVYSPIDGLTPSQVGTIIDEKVDTKDVIAEIVELARLGYFKIEKISSDYLFTKINKSESRLKNFQKYLLESIFANEATEVKLSDLKNKFYKNLGEFKNKLYQNLAAEGIFDGNPQTAKLKWGAFYFLLMGLFFVPMIIFTSFSYNGTPFFLYLVSFLPALPVIVSMSRRTAWGYSLFQQINGLKYYVNLGKWREEIMEKHLFFQEMLPLAISLGIVNQLAKEMKDLGVEPPDYFTNVTTATFINDFNHFYSNSSSNLVSMPASTGHSSWSGGSGFSGGSSGGGFGGGGGSSW